MAGCQVIRRGPLVSMGDHIRTCHSRKRNLRVDGCKLQMEFQRREPHLGSHETSEKRPERDFTSQTMCVFSQSQTVVCTPFLAEEGLAEEGTKWHLYRWRGSVNSSSRRSQNWLPGRLSAAMYAKYLLPDTTHNRDLLSSPHSSNTNIWPHR